ncbi:LacI family transcriptional regulator, partial [Acinetobacter baumannii]|nr:LacI family transcriptional regulator [Acinetobacter baumannii]
IETRAVAVLVKGIGNGFLGALVSELERECKIRQYSFWLQYVEEQEDEMDAAIRIAKEKKPSGMVFLGGDFSHPAQKME